jgi:hypothetical protein
MTKKLKGWNSSKLNLNAKYDSKTMQDWIAVLQGHDVPDAEPNNKAFAEAVRYGFKKLYPDRKSEVIKKEYDFERDGDIDEFNARLKKESEDE